jgi:hypothetical protein
MIRRPGAAADPISRYRNDQSAELTGCIPGTYFRTGELKGSVIANGGAKDLPWYAC